MIRFLLSAILFCFGKFITNHDVNPVLYFQDSVRPLRKQNQNLGNWFCRWEMFECILCFSYTGVLGQFRRPANLIDCNLNDNRETFFSFQWNPVRVLFFSFYSFFFFFFFLHLLKRSLRHYRNLSCLSFSFLFNISPVLRVWTLSL